MAYFDQCRPCYDPQANSYSQHAGYKLIVPSHQNHGSTQASPFPFGAPRSLAEACRLNDESKYRQLPCRTYISIGTCPYRERCDYLHDPRIMSSNFDKVKTPRKKNKEDIVYDSMFWPIMPIHMVSRNLDMSKRPVVFQEYNVPYPQNDVFKRHDESIYSMWMYFVMYCSQLMKDAKHSRMSSSLSQHHMMITYRPTYPLSTSYPSSITTTTTIGSGPLSYSPRSMTSATTTATTTTTTTMKQITNGVPENTATTNVSSSTTNGVAQENSSTKNIYTGKDRLSVFIKLSKGESIIAPRTMNPYAQPYIASGSINTQTANTTSMNTASSISAMVPTISPMPYLPYPIITTTGSFDMATNLDDDWYKKSCDMTVSPMIPISTVSPMISTKTVTSTAPPGLTRSKNSSFDQVKPTSTTATATSTTMNTNMASIYTPFSTTMSTTTSTNAGNTTSTTNVIDDMYPKHMSSYDVFDPPYTSSLFTNTTTTPAPAPIMNPTMTENREESWSPFSPRMESNNMISTIQNAEYSTNFLTPTPMMMEYKTVPVTALSLLSTSKSVNSLASLYSADCMIPILPITSDTSMNMVHSTSTNLIDMTSIDTTATTATATTPLDYTTFFSQQTVVEGKDDFISIARTSPISLPLSSLYTVPLSAEPATTTTTPTSTPTSNTGIYQLHATRIPEDIWNAISIDMTDIPSPQCVSDIINFDTVTNGGVEKGEVEKGDSCKSMKERDDNEEKTVKEDMNTKKNFDTTTTPIKCIDNDNDPFHTTPTIISISPIPTVTINNNNNNIKEEEEGQECIYTSYKTLSLFLNDLLIMNDSTDISSSMIDDDMITFDDNDAIYSYL